jgi:hypothetical protein
MINNMPMFPCLKIRHLMHNRFALSTVVTALIIIVIAVLLAGVVTYFAINVTSTRVQEESIMLSKEHVWFDNNQKASEAAILIMNTGGRDIVIEKVTVRGQTVDWSTTFYYKGAFDLETDIFYVPNMSAGSPTPIDNGVGSYEDVVAATGSLTLPAGQSMLVYVKNPDSISIGDVGITVAIDVYTSQAMYYKETNVEAPLLAVLP